MNDLQPSRRALPRRLVMAAAVVAGLFAAMALDTTTSVGVRSGKVGSRTSALVAEAMAQPPAPPAPPAVKPPVAPDAPVAPAAPAARATETPPAKADASAASGGVDAEITIDERGVRVRKGNGKSREAHVVVGDHEFDSFEQFVEKAPWLAGLVFMVTALVFVMPLLVIVLLIWYKMRRTRMMNETMLKLAERGAVPPADAMQAIATGRAGPALQNLPPTAPLYEQAKALRKSAAWSDLRKGVLIGGVGLGLTIWPVLEGDTANGFGLVLLFVGVGYTVLWYLEERPGLARKSVGTLPPGGA